MKLSMSCLPMALLVGHTMAFTPQTANNKATSALCSESTAVETPEKPTPTPKYTTLNGWTADPSKPCFGLPGAIAPFGYFDPIGLLADKDLSETKRYREAEVMHGRVGMMAVIGYFIAERTPTIAFGKSLPEGMIGNNMVPAVDISTLFFFFLAINFAEAYRARKGWVEPDADNDVMFDIREDHYPGDLGFDPLGLKPADPAKFAAMQNKELSNGRLAMLAAAGFLAQELVTGLPIF